MQSVYDLLDSELSDQAELLMGSHLDGPLKLYLSSLSSVELSVALRACLLLFTITNGTKVPRIMQLQSALAVVASRKDSLVDSTTGSGKTIAMVLVSLLNPASVTLVISPLKRLQVNQVACSRCLHRSCIVIVF